MTKETKQQIIERLEKQIKWMYSSYEYNQAIDPLGKEIKDLKDKNNELSMKCEYLIWKSDILGVVVNRMLPVPTDFVDTINKMKDTRSWFDEYRSFNNVDI